MTIDIVVLIDSETHSFYFIAEWTYSLRRVPNHWPSVTNDVSEWQGLNGEPQKVGVVRSFRADSVSTRSLKWLRCIRKIYTGTSIPKSSGTGFIDVIVAMEDLCWKKGMIGLFQSLHEFTNHQTFRHIVRHTKRQEFLPAKTSNSS